MSSTIVALDLGLWVPFTMAALSCIGLGWQWLRGGL